MTAEKTEREPAGPGRPPESAPRLLVVGAVAPGSSCVGEIILRDLCRCYPKGDLACFALTGKRALARPAGDTEGVPLHREVHPRERPRRWLPGRLGAVSALIDSQCRFGREVRRVVRSVARQGRKHGVEKLCLILDAPTIIAMGPRIAERLRVPLICLVWDPPDYLFRNAGMDRVTRRLLSRRFADTLRASERVAVVSETMAEDYARDFSAECVILRHGLHAEDRRPAATDPSGTDRFVIGFAGGMYARDAWDGLMQALGQVGWRLDGRDVVVRVFGASFQFKSATPAHIEYLGWRSTSETARNLSACDVNYLPQPFTASLSDLARYSFPTKLSTYVATGRPVFVHAPRESSLSRFYERYPIGACCQSLEPGEVVRRLEQLAVDRELYARSAKTVAEVARTELSMERFHDRFAEFVGIDPGCLQPVDRVLKD